MRAKAACFAIEIRVPDGGMALRSFDAPFLSLVAIESKSPTSDHSCSMSSIPVGNDGGVCNTTNYSVITFM
jgi:hypothetical protein